MKKFTRFLAIVLGLGLVAGGLASVANRKDSAFIQAKAEGEVNDTFEYIFSDAYNNVAQTSTLNKVLMCYSGTAHGLPSDTVLNDAATLDNVLLNGVTLSTYSDAKIVVWANQNWFNIMYPKAQVSEGSTLEVLEGLTVGDSVCDHVKFTLNSNGLWKRTFTEVVNATYKNIYPNASYNSSTQLLIVYNGDNLAAGLSISGAEKLKNYDNYISYNGNPISSISGFSLNGWGAGGQPWFFIKFPAASAGDKLVVNSGCKFFTIVLNDMAFEFNGTEWQCIFTGAVNARYASIYSDAYNNGQHATGYNRLMFKYTGTAHNATAIATSAELKNYDKYVFIDDSPLSAYAGGSTQISPWTGQLWIQIIYPATAVSVGSILTIKEGTKIGDAIFEKIAFGLNSSEKWEKLTLIENDELVADGDYLLFTPSDYNLSGNNSIVYYKDLGTVLTDSFGFRVNVAVPSADFASYIGDFRFGSTDTYGNNPMFRLFLNDGTYRFGMFFNGGYDWNTYLTASNWTADATHLIEFYAIKSSSTQMTCLFGIDGILIWKTNKDISSVDFTGHTFISIQNKGTAQQTTYYSSLSDNTEIALNRFASRKLMYGSVPFTNTSDTGACRGENGYYAKAKAFYNTYLNATQRKAFASESGYAQLRERMIAWGTANGETISFNASNGDLVVSSSNRIALFTGENGYKDLILVLSLVSVLVGFFLTLVFLKKKKESK